MITIIDYGAGNIKSIQNMLKKVGVVSCISKNAEDIANAEKLILPGVGHFDHGMRQLKASGVIDTLNKKVLEEKIPMLGICLGAQLLGQNSEEGMEKGLGWLKMKVVKFDANKLDKQLKVPHMGWNYIAEKKRSKLFVDMPDNPRFYFVHSYHMHTDESKITLGSSNYGYDFVSAVEHENIYGVQFHPEKSHKYGKQLLSNFAKI